MSLAKFGNINIWAIMSDTVGRSDVPEIPIRLHLPNPIPSHSHALSITGRADLTGN